MQSLYDYSTGLMVTGTVFTLGGIFLLYVAAKSIIVNLSQFAPQVPDDSYMMSFFNNHKTLAASLLGSDETSWEKPEDMHNAIDQFIERQKADLMQREQEESIENQEEDAVSASSLVASNDSFFHHHEQKAIATIEEKKELEPKTQFR